MTMIGLIRSMEIINPTHRRMCPHMALSTNPAYTAVASAAPTYSIAARMISSSHSNAAAIMLNTETKMSMIGPPPSPEPGSSA